MLQKKCTMIILGYRACSNCREDEGKFAKPLLDDLYQGIKCKFTFVLGINFELYWICIHVRTMEDKNIYYLTVLYFSGKGKVNTV